MWRCVMWSAVEQCFDLGWSELASSSDMFWVVLPSRDAVKRLEVVCRRVLVGCVTTCSAVESWHGVACNVLPSSIGLVWRALTSRNGVDCFAMA